MPEEIAISFRVTESKLDNRKGGYLSTFIEVLGSVSNVSLPNKLLDDLESVDSLSQIQINVLLILSAGEFEVDRAHDLVDLKNTIIHNAANFHEKSVKIQEIEKNAIRCISAR